MISEAKLKLFESVGGDPDAWARASRPGDRTILTEAGWNQISALVNQLTLVKRGLASPDLEQRVMKLLRETTATPAVAARLLEISQESPRRLTSGCS